MSDRMVIWPPAVQRKLTQFRSGRFTPGETFDYIAQFILETEAMLTNPVFGKGFTEISGQYAGISRIVIKKFKVYYERNENHVVIVAVMFPGEL